MLRGYGTISNVFFHLCFKNISQRLLTSIQEHDWYMLMSLTFKRLQVVDSNNPFKSHILPSHFAAKVSLMFSFFPLLLINYVKSHFGFPKLDNLVIWWWLIHYEKSLLDWKKKYMYLPYINVKKKFLVPIRYF